MSDWASEILHKMACDKNKSKRQSFSNVGSADRKH